MTVFKELIFYIFFLISMPVRGIYAILGFYYLQEGMIGTFLLTYFTCGVWNIFYPITVFEYLFKYEEDRGALTHVFEWVYLPWPAAYMLGLLIFNYFNVIYGSLYPMFHLNISQIMFLYFLFFFDGFYKYLISSLKLKLIWRRVISVIIKIAGLYFVLLGKSGVDIDFGIAGIVGYEAFLQYCIR